MTISFCHRGSVTFDSFHSRSFDTVNRIERRAAKFYENIRAARIKLPALSPWRGNEDALRFEKNTRKEAVSRRWSRTDDSSTSGGSHNRKVAVHTRASSERSSRTFGFGLPELRSVRIVGSFRIQTGSAVCFHRFT